MAAEVAVPRADLTLSGGGQSGREGRTVETLELFIFNQLIQERRKSLDLEQALDKEQAALAEAGKTLSKLRGQHESLKQDRDGAAREAKQVQGKLKSEEKARLAREQELSSARQELARLRGHNLENLELREQHELQETLQEGLRRVLDAMRRRQAVEKLASTRCDTPQATLLCQEAEARERRRASVVSWTGVRCGYTVRQGTRTQGEDL